MQVILTNDLIMANGWRGEMSEIRVRAELLDAKISEFERRHYLDHYYQRMQKEISKLLHQDFSTLTITLRPMGIKRMVEIKMRPKFPSGSVLKSLVQRFQENVKISLYLKGYDTMNDFASAEGMEICGTSFACERVSTHATAFPLNLTGSMHVKLVADISLPRMPLCLYFESPEKGSSLSVDLAGNRSISIDISSSREPSAQKILETGEFSDLTIRAGNGAEIKAHKSFLSISSPVLQAMLKSEMDESQTGQVYMTDLSEEGVKAFLRYVYYGDLKQPSENIHICYELFHASHKYLMQDLEAKTKMLLIQAKNKDVRLELALKIYMFTKNIQSAVEVKIKAVQILKAKWDEFEKLQEYDDLFEKPSNAKTVKELFKDLAKIAPSGCTCPGNAD